MLTTVVVIRALNPTSLTSSFIAVSTISSGGTSFPKIDHIKAVIFKKNFYNILANIMNISFYGSRMTLSLACSLSPLSLASSSFKTANAIFAASALIRSCGKMRFLFQILFRPWSSAGIDSSLIISVGFIFLESLLLCDVTSSCRPFSMAVLSVISAFVAGCHSLHFLTSMLFNIFLTIFIIIHQRTERRIIRTHHIL